MRASGAPLPHPIRVEGQYSTMDEIFTSKRIFFWSADSSGCAYYRCELPAAELARRGHETHTSSVMPDAWLHTADVIVGQRVCEPGATVRWQQMAREGRCALVFECDDDLLDIDPSNGPAWSFFRRPEIRENVIRNIEVADLVTVSTEPLAEVMRRHNRNVAVLPNCVPSSLLDAPHADGPKGLTLGWSGGASHALDLAEARDPVRQFLRRYPDAGLHIMGHVDSDFCKAMPRERLRTTRWVESVPAFHAAVDFDVALAPLRPSPFNRSKSAIRCLEAAALGIPVIASDFGPYAEFVRDGETGLLVSRPHEWARHLRTLLDPFVRREMGAKTRAVAAGHTIERNIELWEKALT
jgi:glycosyltransferase involved in cell wall biosynthesis